MWTAISNRVTETPLSPHSRSACGFSRGPRPPGATASGMAAVFNALAAIVETGDRIVAGRALFGSCYIVLDEILRRWGVTTDFVDGTLLDQWESALADPVAAVFFESPSNPMQELIDISAVSALAHEAGAVVVVDNVFTSPLLQRPLELGADVVAYSTTKHLDGQGRTLGGAILGTHEFIYERLQPIMRHTGPSMSPFNAWVLIKSLETLRLRVDHQTRSALTIADRLASHPRLLEVRYPFLESHPQFDLATRQMKGGGTVVTFELNGEKGDAFEVLNRLQLIRHLQQSRRYQEPCDASRHHHPSTARSRRPQSTRHHRRRDPRIRRTGRYRGHLRRPGASARVRHRAPQTTTARWRSATATRPRQGICR